MASCATRLALATAGYYGLSASDAEQVAGEVAVAVLAIRYGISTAQRHCMESAFEHDDLNQALFF